MALPHAMTHYNTKFGDPASISKKNMLWTMFSVKNLETKWPPVCHLCINWSIFVEIFQDLSKFSLFCPLMDPKSRQPLYLNKSESPSSKHVSCQVWLKLA